MEEQCRRRHRFVQQLVGYIYGPLPEDRKQVDRVRGLIFDALVKYDQEQEGNLIAQADTRRA